MRHAECCFELQERKNRNEVREFLKIYIDGFKIYNVSRLEQTPLRLRAEFSYTKSVFS